MHMLTILAAVTKNFGVAVAEATLVFRCKREQEKTSRAIALDGSPRGIVPMVMDLNQAAGWNNNDSHENMSHRTWCRR